MIKVAMDLVTCRYLSILYSKVIFMKKNIFGSVINWLTSGLTRKSYNSLNSENSNVNDQYWYSFDNSTSSIEDNPIFETGLSLFLSTATNLIIKVIFKNQDISPVAKNFILNFLESPNLEESGKVFRHVGFKHLLIKSCVYLYWNGDIRTPKFYWIESSEVQENKNDSGIVVSYSFNSSAGCVASIYSMIHNVKCPKINKDGLCMKIESNKSKPLTELARKAIELYEMQTHKYSLEIQANSLAQIVVDISKGAAFTTSEYEGIKKEIDACRRILKKRDKFPEIRMLTKTGSISIDKISNPDPNFELLDTLAQNIWSSMGIPSKIIMGQGNDVGYNAMRNIYQLFLYNNIYPFTNFFLSQIEHYFKSIILANSKGFGMHASRNSVDFKLESDPSSELWFNERITESAKNLIDVDFLTAEEKRKLCYHPANAVII